MSPKISTKRFENQLLTSLKADDLALIEPFLEPVALDLRMVLERPNVPIKHIYFPKSGIASVVSTADPGTLAEVGLIGLEGVSGTAVIFESDRSPHHTYMQVAGSGQRVELAKFQTALSKSVTFRSHFLHYAHAFMIQTAYTAAANARAKLEQRLARWILMVHDRLQDNGVPLTHEFLGIMLGVRRAGVTEALLVLAGRGVIRKDKVGSFILVNRKGLEMIAGPFYGAPEREYVRLMA